MPAPANTRTFEVDVPALRVFRHVDADNLHPNVRDAIERREGRADYVDTDLARDWEETEEIIDNTIGAALVDSDGTVVFEREGKDAFKVISRAAAGAKVSVEIDLGIEDAPKSKPRVTAPDEAVSSTEEVAI